MMEAYIIQDKVYIKDKKKYKQLTLKDFGVLYQLSQLALNEDNENNVDLTNDIDTICELLETIGVNIIEVEE